MLVLIISAHPHIRAFSIVTEKFVWQMTAKEYIHAFFSQIAWGQAIYAFILAVVFADKANSRPKEKELLAVNLELHNKILPNPPNTAQFEVLKLYS